MVRTAQEQALEDALPSGWNHTLYDPEQIRRLQGAPMNTLGDTVDEYQGSTITESDIIQYVVSRTLTAFKTVEETIEFPGLGLATEGTPSLLERFAAKYKEDNDTPSGTIKDPARAGADDIVFSFATAPVWNEIAGTTIDTFQQPGLTSGNTLELIGDSGIDETANGAGNTLSLDPDEYLFLTGDYVDLADGQSAVSAFELADLDSKGYGPVETLFQGRLSGTHVHTAQGGYATATLDVDAKVYESKDAELVPVAFYLGPGTKAPSLT